MQEFAKNTLVLASCCNDHFPIVFSLELKDMLLCEKGLLKFNNSFTSNADYVESFFWDSAYAWPRQNHWHATQEFLKYEIIKFNS